MELKATDAERLSVDRMSALAIVGLDRGVDTRARLLELQRGAYQTVALPLEPYAAVFTFFVVPQIITVTPQCIEQSKQSYTDAAPDSSLPCAIVTQFVLAFRTIALVMVFFASTVHREALVGDLSGLTSAVCGGAYHPRIICYCFLVVAAGVPRHKDSRWCRHGHRQHPISQATLPIDSACKIGMRNQLF